MAVRWSRVGVVLLVCGVAGVGLFAMMAWRATSSEVIGQADAMRRFDALRARLGSAGPIVSLGPDGTVINRAPAPADDTAAAPDHIIVSVYRADTNRLVETRIPFWFFRIKAPAADVALQGTGLSLQRLGITADDLRRYGPRVVIDHPTAVGGRLLVWTE
jgi:hypothetical protein